MGRKLLSLFLVLALTIPFAACAGAEESGGDLTDIVLSDQGVTVDDDAASQDSEDAVYVGAEIVYYQSGQDETYGEGTEADSHDPEEAEAHTVVTITQPGTYRLSGSLSLGQVAVDLGEDAKEDPQAVVTLILDGVDLTCTVAPAVLFYNVYECGPDDTETASPTVDTSAAGANVVLADGSVNRISGSYVARIYKEGTTDKLHKYDGAFYSRMSMNISGGEEGDGVLEITAENEGLDSELHLTINGGDIRITAQNDGINTNEDGVSVTTVNGGTLTINAGLGAEGDGIDSNGYLVVNGGTVVSSANGQVGEGGLDSDMGIYLNGGTVLAFGSRNDTASGDSTQALMELTFSSAQSAGSLFTVEDGEGNVLFSSTPVKEYSSVTLSSPALTYGETYAVYVDGVLQQYTGSGAMGGPSGMGPGGAPGERPGGQEPSEPPVGEEQTPPEDWVPAQETVPPEGEPPEELPEEALPEDRQPGQGGRPGGGEDFGAAQDGTQQAGSTAFTPTAESHSFSGVSAAEELPFTDVSAESASYDAVVWVWRQGLMNGTSDTTFSPEETVSRAMAVTVLARMAGAEAVDSDAFSDVESGTWYSGYVGWAISNGIVEGDGAGHFLPEEPVTREQMALMLSRYAEGSGASYTAPEGAGSVPLTRAELAQMLYSYQQG